MASQGNPLNLREVYREKVRASEHWQACRWTLFQACMCACEVTQSYFLFVTHSCDSFCLIFFE